MRSRWQLVAAGLAVALTLVRRPDAALVVVVAFVLIVPFERRFPRHQQKIRRKEVGTDVAYALLAAPLNAIATVIAAIVAITSLLWLPGLVLRPVVLALPPLGKVVVALALFDLVGYWAHRCVHEIPLLWRFHSVHHSTTHLDWISGFRSHPLDGVLLAPPFAFLIGAGVGVGVSGALVVVQVVTGLFLHANVRWRWRPLQRFVITPEFHHWHHADDLVAMHSNYAALLPLWDLAFGTFFCPADRRPERYGVSDPIPRGIAAQLTQPLRGLGSRLAGLRSPRRAVVQLVGDLRRGARQVRHVLRRGPSPLGCFGC